MAHTLAGLTKWAQREDWREPFNELVDLHLGQPCAKAEVAIEALPRLCNSDGDDIAWTTVNYPLGSTADVEAVKRALAEIASLRPADKMFWN